MTTKDIFEIKSREHFQDLALEVFQFQFEKSPVYRTFCDHLHKSPQNVTHLDHIPYLPIEFFKRHEIINSEAKVQTVFESSGTTGKQTSKHYVSDLSIYEQSFLKGFELNYGNIEDYCFLALLPSYLEREHSSLIYMVKELIGKSKHPMSGFYLEKGDELKKTLNSLQEKRSKILLIGVSYALLDFVEKGSFPLSNTIVMETGGMKGRRKEMVREELHHYLKEGFGQKNIHSEYGMTELLSQAYSKGKGIFNCPPWMKVVIRDPEDPLTLLKTGQNGGVNIIDLANINSCAFIATQDLGKLYPNGSFEILGRFDHSDIRGCNLLAL
ncbi:MAG: acyl transferase [Eudoraea sp.]|uniref:LuxE/PaaK family acyltransferase n=1 Tax=Eudoraea sp. TaxID=1979955 RepID=UPI003C746288